MTRINLSLCAVVCLLVTGDWLIPMTSGMLVDVVTNYDTPMTSRDSREQSSEVLRLARVLLSSPRYQGGSRLDSSSTMDRGLLHPLLLANKRNNFDPILMMPDLFEIGRK